MSETTPEIRTDGGQAHDREQSRLRSLRRRVMNRWGADKYIEGVGVEMTWSDAVLGIIALFATIGTFESASGMLPGWAWPLAVLLALVPAAALGAVAFIAHEHDTGPWRWLCDRIDFIRSPKALSAVADDADERTDTITQVSRFHPDGSVERTDGDLVGGGEIEPVPMSLAGEEKWEEVADAFASGINSLTEPVMFKTTGRRVDPDAITDPYKERRDDPDVEANDQLAEVIDIYANHWPSELRGRGTALREYYAMTVADRHAVQMNHRGALGTLADLPYVGDLFAAIAGETTDMTEDEIHYEQAEQLDNQLNAIKGAAESVDGTSFRRLDSDDLARILEEHWRGKRTDHDQAPSDAPSRLRTMPVATAGERDDGSLIGGDPDATDDSDADADVAADGGDPA